MVLLPHHVALHKQITNIWEQWGPDLTDLWPESSADLKVVLDFILQEARVFFQSPSELRNTGVDLQQLHWVAIMVPWRCYVLEDTVNVKTVSHASVPASETETGWCRDDTWKHYINSPRPRPDQSLWTGASSEFRSYGGEPRFAPPQIHSCAKTPKRRNLGLMVFSWLFLRVNN